MPSTSARRPNGVLLALAASWALASCAAPGSDVHLAPLYTRIATADGGTLTEVAGGLYRQHRRDDGDFLEWATLAPLYGIDRQRNGDWSAEHPFLLGRSRMTNGELTSYVVPLYLGWTRTTSTGETRSVWLSILGWMFQRHGEKTHLGWFPFYGHFEDLFTFDSASFTLWPLYIRNERAGRVSHHFLWPFFGWTTGGGEASWHVFPLFGHAGWEGRYDRNYLLWPFFHWQKSYLGGDGEESEHTWWFWPFLGHKQRGTYESWTWLWPFFGYAHDSRSGFWALDFPFFLVRLQHGPDQTKRTRFWPFWSRFEEEGFTSTNFLWPLGYLRHEDSEDAERDYANFIPFWQSWDRLDKVTGETSAFRKAWPLWRYEEQGEWRSGALLEFDPFFKNDLVPRHLTSFFRIYEWEEDPDIRRERALLGLYRRERGRGEDRRSLSGLWASRSYVDEGRNVHETSLLFGLLRWRVTAGEGFDMLRPAFPGPGWPRPAQAAPATESRTYF
jgi:hypothetical protein